jgi:surface carbohydrate biosynthesis protein
MNLLQACFIRVEVKKREFVSRIDLAIEMVNRGVPVVIGECSDPDVLLKLGIDKSYFFGKCAQPNLLEIFKPLLDRGWIFGALDEEGLLPDNAETFAKERFSSTAADTFKDVFFFGDDQKEAFDRIFGPRDSFIVSGNPRTDMWQSNCYNLYESLIQDIKNKYGDFVLLPLNFACYTNNQKFKDGSETKFRNSSKDLGLSFKAMQDRAEFIFDNLCKLAERLANEEKIKVIMRPHPSDDLETIKKLMIKHGVKSNLIQCIATNDIFPWISAARILFHNCCTTSLEAAFIGTPVVTFAPSNIEYLQNSEINSLFPVAKNYEDALGFLSNSKNTISSNFKDSVADWRSLSLENSGKTASFIANRILQRNKFEPSQNLKTYKKSIDFKRLKSEVKGKLASLIGKRQNQVYLDKFPHTKIEEVKNIVHHICKYRGYNEQPKVNRINSRLFSITP